MTVERPEPGDAQSGGLVQSLRNLAATAVGILQTRLELLVAEIEEERLRILQVLLWGSAALFFLALSVVLLTLAVVILSWDAHRVLVTVLLGAFYLAIGAVLLAVARHRARRSKLLSASLAELEKDREDLTPT